MVKKENKIIVVVSPDKAQREKMIAKLAVRLGFAQIASDALKIIKQDIYSYDLATSYFVMCANYNFNGSSTTSQKLYELAARGVCVIVGVKSVPHIYDFICETFYPENL